MTSAETRAWIDAQEAYFQKEIESRPRFEPLRKWIESIGTFPLYGFPKKVGDRVFYSYREIGEQDSVLMMMAYPNGRPRQILPEGEGQFWAFKASPNGRFLTFKRRHGGSLWSALQILDVDKGQILKEKLANHYGNGNGVVWSADSKAFFYTNFEALEHFKISR